MINDTWNYDIDELRNNDRMDIWSGSSTHDRILMTIREPIIYDADDNDFDHDAMRAAVVRQAQLIIVADDLLAIAKECRASLRRRSGDVWRSDREILDSLNEIIAAVEPV